MHPVLASVGPFTVYSWGFMVALGFIAGLFTAMKYARREGLNPDVMPDLFIYVVISAIGGARLFYVIGFFDMFRDNLISVFYVNQAGMVFLGGLCLSFVTVIVFSRVKRLDLWKLLDAVSPATAIGYAIGRIGCFLNGCCYGIEFCGIRQPTQLYSSFAGLVIFIALVLLYRRKAYDGQIALYGLVMYSIYRFLIEFLRYSPVHVMGLTLNQLLCVLLFAASSLALWKKNTI